MRNYPQIEHVDIPYDELKVFQKSIQNDSYQDVLVETLLLSTLAQMHHDKITHKVSVLITAKSMWIIRKNDKGYFIKAEQILYVVKSNIAPELVIITENHKDNLRLSASSEIRCQAIISGLSYQATMIYKKQISLIKVENSELSYFERKGQEKVNGRNINFIPYPKLSIAYEKPFNEMKNVYGYLKITQLHKILLERQIPQNIVPGRQGHKIYIAKIIEEPEAQNRNKTTKKSFHLPSQDGLAAIERSDDYEKYICHYLDRKNSYLNEIHEHTNKDFIQQLKYARIISDKIQLFFQYGIPLKKVRPTPTIFTKIWKLYDQIKEIDPQRAISTDLFLITCKSPLIPVKKSQEKVQQILSMELSRQKSGQLSIHVQDTHHEIVIRQFRYEFLREGEELDQFYYQLSDSYVSNALNTEQKYFHKKMFNLGMILYQLFYELSLLNYLVPNKKGNYQNNIKDANNSDKFQQLEKETFDTLISLKSCLQYCSLVDIHPQFTQISQLVSQGERDLIDKLLRRVFCSQEQMFDHQWFK